MQSSDSPGVQLKGEPPCDYSILSESTSGGTTTTRAWGVDRFLYTCIQSLSESLNQPIRTHRPGFSASSAINVE